ncbi:hypothetical protein JTE90_028803 [Oedothorax gibbosus]|uniref:Uncharacterized protein n=1 Tax=Oedothorax gibbosus TaxID=931172 RepID=A0AAV6VZK4_9ARAC|nr:hypothetical protein JTE90_028803 [Oedothorax gibbosus]
MKCENCGGFCCRRRGSFMNTRSGWEEWYEDSFGNDSETKCEYDPVLSVRSEVIKSQKWNAKLRTFLLQKAGMLHKYGSVLGQWYDDVI